MFRVSSINLCSAIEWSRLALFYVAATFSLSVNAQLLVPDSDSPASVILSTEDFEITVQDFDYYLVEREIDEDQANEVFSKEGMVRTAVENIYVIKVLSSLAGSKSDIDMDEVEWLVDHYRDRLLMNRYLDLEVARRVDGVDWEALTLEYFLANQGEFVSAEQVDVSHILLSISDRSDSEALSLAGNLLERLRNGASFEELAAEYSDDEGSRENGGRVGYFSRGMMVAPFEVAAFSLDEPGELSEPVRTEFGYHIIKFNERKASAPLAFEQVKSRLIPDVKERRERLVRQDVINEVKSGQVGSGLEVDMDVLEAVESRYVGQGTATDPLQRIREVLGDD